MDNQILIYSADNFRQNRKKRFAGHSVAGYACQVGFSPDGKWISSGDAAGNVVFWDWKTGGIKSRLAAHSKVVIAHEWLPHETVRARGRHELAAGRAILTHVAVQGDHRVLGRIDQALGAYTAGGAGNRSG
jgi:WD40 repeat protein